MHHPHQSLPVKNKSIGLLVFLETSIALVTLVSQYNSCACKETEPKTNSIVIIIFFILLLILFTKIVYFFYRTPCINFLIIGDITKEIKATAKDTIANIQKK